jgi:hypothetical protein
MSRGKFSKENQSSKAKLVDLEFERIRKENEKRDLERARKAAMLRIEQQPIIADLLKAGIQVECISDLVNTSEKYEEAIPVLIEHLSKPYHINIKEDITRALAVKEAKGVACKVIIDEYKKAPKEKPPYYNREFYYRWAFGNTMQVIATEDYADEIIEIVMDPSNGPSRDMFVRSLGKMRLIRVKEALEKLREDEDKIIRDEAQKALNKILKKKNLK